MQRHLDPKWLRRCRGRSIHACVQYICGVRPSQTKPGAAPPNAQCALAVRPLHHMLRPTRGTRRQRRRKQGPHPKRTMCAWGAAPPVADTHTYTGRTSLQTEPHRSLAHGHTIDHDSVCTCVCMFVYTVCVCTTLKGPTAHTPPSSPKQGRARARPEPRPQLPAPPRGVGK